MPPLRITFEINGAGGTDPGVRGRQGEGSRSCLGFWLVSEMDGGASLLRWGAGLDHCIWGCLCNVHVETEAREGFWDERKAFYYRVKPVPWTDLFWYLTPCPWLHPHTGYLFPGWQQQPMCWSPFTPLPHHPFSMQQPELSTVPPNSCLWSSGKPFLNSLPPKSWLVRSKVKK